MAHSHKKLDSFARSSRPFICLTVWKTLLTARLISAGVSAQFRTYQKLWIFNYGFFVRQTTSITLGRKARNYKLIKNKRAIVW